MRRFLAATQMMTLISTSATLQLISPSIQQKQEIKQNTTTLSRIEQQQKTLSLDSVSIKRMKTIQSLNLNWEHIQNNYQTILKQNLNPKALNFLLSNSQLLAKQTNSYQQFPFGGINKFIPGFVSTVYINENLLSFLVSVIKYHHGEAEVISETIAAVLLIIGFRAGGVILGGITAILYSYIEILAACDQGAGVGFYLILGVILDGVWPQ